MPQLSIPAQQRTAVGKGPNRRLRAQGMIPAVVYGRDRSPRALSLSPIHITEIVRSARGVNTIFSLEIAGEESEQVMIHDYQLHPLDHSVLHADLMRVDPKREAEWRVPIRLVGDAKGVKRGGHLDFVTRALSVVCRPLDIPEHLSLVVSDLDYGDAVRASAVELPTGVKLASEPELVLVHIAAPKVSAEDEEVEEDVAETD